MSKPRRTRWVCPDCGDGKLGPQRPRRENIVRYCLPCSEKAGRLVERETPALTKNREKRAEQMAERRAVKAKRDRKRERRKTHIRLRDAAGREVELDPIKETKRLAKKAGVTIHRVTWNRRRGGSSGRAWPWNRRVHLSIAHSESLEGFCALVAHEAAHVAAGPGHGHDDRWKDEYERIAAVLWDTKPVFRLEVAHYRYAIDPKIEGQLIATSRGEYKRSKAKLPLAGRVIAET